MRTKAASWILIVAAFPLAAVGCGDDTGATTTSTSSNDDGEGGSNGDGGGGGATTSTSTSTTTTTTTTTTSSTTTSTSTGGEGGQGGAGGQGGGADCGNGAIDGDEVCDGDALGDATCEGEGFVGGTLACNDTCDGFDTSACTTCGDGIADGGDACDGDDLGDGTCQSEGFDAGTLGCNDDCTFDTALCVDFTCGDGTRNGDEDCEGADLGAGTCESEGFTLGGTLACGGTCQYDTSGCNTCGDAVINGDDVCDGAALGGATCATLPGGPFTGGTLACAAGCAAFDTTGCTNFPLPGAGELVITEIMINPLASGDTIDEWIEFHNPSASSTFQLAGCTFSSGGDGAGITIDADLAIEPGGFVTIAKTGTVSFTPDLFFPSGWAFGNSANGDTVTLTCGGATVDTVDWAAANGFTVPSGASIQLDGDSLTAAANDAGANWCDALVNVGLSTAEFGTPGSANPPCASDLVIGSCHLQFPSDITGDEGTMSPQVFGRVFIDGVTDVNQTGNDNPLGLLAQVGYGPADSDPNGNVSWSWTNATANAGYGTASPDFLPDEDEYGATFTLPADEMSPYDFAYRFSGDGGDTWTYCDVTNDGTYTPADAGDLVTEPTAQVFDLIFSEYIEAPSGNGNNKAYEITNLGAAVDLSACVVQIHTNGAVAPQATALALTGPLADGETLTVCHTEATHVVIDPVDGDPCDVRTTTTTTYNGDDVLVLRCANNIIDSIGQANGMDVGDAWIANGVETWNSILRRSCDVTVGDRDITNAYDPSVEWESFAYAQATMDDDLDQYVCQ